MKTYMYNIFCNKLSKDKIYKLIIDKYFLQNTAFEFNMNFDTKSCTSYYLNFWNHLIRINSLYYMPVTIFKILTKNKFYEQPHDVVIIFGMFADAVLPAESI
jgi:hypothetical protein